MVETRELTALGNASRPQALEAAAKAPGLPLTGDWAAYNELWVNLPLFSQDKPPAD